MPGSRLAYPERRQITAGLSAGLTYAEIARRINRPTSTISREIARNGGPGNYRAEPAQRATQQRARRRPPATTTPPIDTPSADEGVLAAVDAGLTLVMVRMGLPRMASRVFIRMFLSDAEDHTAAELTAALRVSPASISKAMGYLTDVGLVRRERDGRRERYRVGRDVWSRACSISAELNQTLADTARRGAELVGARTPTGARLTEMAWCFENLYGLDSRGAARWAAFLEYAAGARPYDPDTPITPAALHCPDCGGAVAIPDHLVDNRLAR